MLLEAGRRAQERVLQLVQPGFTWITRRYSHGVAFFLKRGFLGLLLFVGMLGLIGVLYKGGAERTGA